MEKVATTLKVFQTAKTTIKAVTLSCIHPALIAKKLIIQKKSVGGDQM
jgi:hypothetical protein